VSAARDHWWWRPGWRPGRRFYTFHVTWRDQPAVQELAAQARARLAEIRGLDPVPGPWLHLTTQGIGFTDEVSGADLAAITAAARARLAAVHPVLVQSGRRRPCRKASPAGSARQEPLIPSGTRCAPRSARYGAPARCRKRRNGHHTCRWPTPTPTIPPTLSTPPSVTAEPRRRPCVIRLGRDQHLYEWESIETLPLRGQAED
jgi:hypothetical protein